MNDQISKRITSFLKNHFQLEWNGIHGASHWARVRQNGLIIARQNGADPVVVSLFALLHDIERRSDGSDPEHGARAARLVQELNGEYFNLHARQMDLLRQACELHSDGETYADITIQTCWDADRLDLGRVGVKPDPMLLCTAAARNQDLIDWCYLRAKRWASDLAPIKRTHHLLRCYSLIFNRGLII
ncbi:hypothetical protein Maes01_02773 [Microbulbifer aestuariivivens]|uniref:HD domain-containing protein n=1 Tax=Microbulbifer aestuariivivens TaxID=1908308 RepID=A0ABP9WV89_9GAMM